MALQTINTIQSGAKATYSDNYIKQALSNLGQRTGAKGDSIINQDFKILDIKNYNVNPDTVKYVCVIYNPLENTVKCVYNSNSVNVDNTNIFADLESNESVEILNVPIVESIGDWNDLNNVRIYKNQQFNSYFISGICTLNGETKELIAVEFSENGNVLINGISINVSESEISYVNAKSDDENISIVENSRFIIANGSGLTYQTLNEDIYNFNNVSSIIEYLNEGSEVEVDTELDLDFYRTKFQYYVNVLPIYAKKLYNEKIYFSDNSYTALKRLIVSDFVKNLYNDSEFKPEDNNVFEVYFPADYSIACLVNSNTNNIYVSYDILVNFLHTNIDVENLKGIVAESNSDDKVIAYKFYITYLDEDKYVDEILIDKLYTLPYIKENEFKENVWVINDNLTDIKTTGKDAGNPNIMMMSYIKGDSGEQVAYNDESTINIEVLHTYEENIGDKNFKEMLKYNTINDGITKTFHYYLPVLTAVENRNFYEFEIDLPNINKIISENSTFERILKNTLLMTFVDLKISDSVYNTGSGDYTLDELFHGKDNNKTTSFITVYWHIVEDGNDSYTWEAITNPIFGPEEDNPRYPVLDMGSMFSFSDFVDYYVHTLMTPDEYKFSWIVFDSVNTYLKQEDDVVKRNEDDNVHLVLKPDIASYYSTSTTNIKYDGYNNNLNFAPKFIKGTGSDALGNKINIIQYKGEQNTNEILAINDEPNIYGSVTKFFELNNRKLNNISKINNDYVPNSDENNAYPTLDFREMLSMNQSLLNRLNIISIGPDKRVYNAYFGHPTLGSNQSEYDYDVIAIGSYSQNHNMNSNITLTNSTNSFSLFDRIRFDLPTFTKEDAVFEKIVLKKLYGTNKYFATITVDLLQSQFLHKYYTIEINDGQVNKVNEFFVTKVSKYFINAESDFNEQVYGANPNTVNVSYRIVDGNIVRSYVAFDAASYINQMDKLGRTVIFDDDPQHPRTENEKNIKNYNYSSDGYMIVRNPIYVEKDDGFTVKIDNNTNNDIQLSFEDYLNFDADYNYTHNFSNIKIQSGFDNHGGLKVSDENQINNRFVTFICYFNVEDKNKYSEISVDTIDNKNDHQSTGYSKKKLWLKLENVQEILTGTKFIQ